MQPDATVTCVTGHKVDCYNGDSLQTAYALANEGIQVDAVITDPPYIIKHLGGGGCFQDSNQKMFNPEASGIENIRDGYDIQEHMNAWVNRLGAKNVVCFCSNDQVAETYNEMVRVGLSPTIMVWHKYNACPMVNNTWIPDVEYFVVGRRLGKDGYINNNVPTEMKSRVRRLPMCNERKWHPTAKPMQLCRDLVEVLCPEDGVVFEPFGGSGSTPIACLKIRRNGIACESDAVLPGCFDRMVQEIKREAGQNRLF